MTLVVKQTSSHPRQLRTQFHKTTPGGTRLWDNFLHLKVLPLIYPLVASDFAFIIRFDGCRMLERMRCCCRWLKTLEQCGTCTEVIDLPFLSGIDQRIREGEFEGSAFDSRSERFYDLFLDSEIFDSCHPERLSELQYERQRQDHVVWELVERDGRDFS